MKCLHVYHSEVFLNQFYIWYASDKDTNTTISADNTVIGDVAENPKWVDKVSVWINSSALSLMANGKSAHVIFPTKKWLHFNPKADEIYITFIIDAVIIDSDTIWCRNKAKYLEMWFDTKLS